MPDGPWVDEWERRHLFRTGRFFGDGPGPAVPAAGAAGCGGCLFGVVVVSLAAFVVVGLLTGTFEGDDEGALDLSGEQVWVGSLDCAEGPMGLSLTMRQAERQDEATPGIDLDLVVRYFPEPLRTDVDAGEGAIDRRDARGTLDGSTLSFEVADPGDQPYSATSGLGTVEETGRSSEYTGGVAAPACDRFAVSKQTR